MNKTENLPIEHSLEIENRKLKIIFFGTPDFVIPILETLNNQFDLIAVVSTPDASAGRKQIMTPSPVALEAEKAGINILKPSQFSDSLITGLTDLSPDLFIVASYGKIVPQTVLNIPRLGSINIHPSKLPKYRGPSPIQSQILDGVTDSGVTFILMDAQIDHGPILKTVPFQIKPEDTFRSLHYSMFESSARELPAVIVKYASGEIKPEPQDHGQAAFCTHITRTDGYFDIDNPPSPDRLDRMIRAYYPWPTAWTRWNGKVIKFLPDSKIQIEGKNPVNIKEFLNGYPSFPLKIV